ncbi:cytochrome c [Bacteriovorax stolpii]|uniref:Cytochrome C n=1 Tax=Bacteriovorax stolpii TaxID=960 RepID=A0A2K9NSS4_BACTC|nr:cytochrome c [Bacteriovorax stolpii]AUN98573.1 cytochrome C [Bacteriovorax stolpii]QDK41447.1 cytochrome c [Bacteriovorax stolpii]TDP55923.1 cytochrome c553 [Bacteriovorax stolpii]
MKSVLSLVSVFVLSSLLSTGFAQDAAKGKALYATCIQCHGENGEGNLAKKAPKLSGQHDWYVVKQVTEIKSGVRKNPDMQPYVKGLSDQDIKDLAAYIVTL